MLTEPDDFMPFWAPLAPVSTLNSCIASGAASTCIGIERIVVICTVREIQSGIHTARPRFPLLKGSRPPVPSESAPVLPPDSDQLNKSASVQGRFEIQRSQPLNQHRISRFDQCRIRLDDLFHYLSDFNTGLTAGLLRRKDDPGLDNVRKLGKPLPAGMDQWEGLTK
jgi:hypothetical protein